MILLRGINKRISDAAGPGVPEARTIVNLQETTAVDSKDDSSFITMKHLTRKLFTNAVLGAALSFLEFPMASCATSTNDPSMMLLAELPSVNNNNNNNNNSPTSTSSYAGTYGTSSTTTPYFNSASAARLLVNPMPSSRERINPDARRQLAKQRSLQDSRLELCRESGIDWEQCFYYGTAGGPAGEGDPASATAAAPLTLPSMYGNAPNSRGKNNNFNAGSGSSMVSKKGISMTQGKIPTW